MNNEETLFHQALAKPPAERAAFLDRACGADTQLRARLEALLHAHEHPGTFLSHPILGHDAAAGSGPGQSQPPTEHDDGAEGEPGASATGARLQECQRPEQANSGR